MTVGMVHEITGDVGTTFSFTVGDTATTLVAQSAAIMLSSGVLCTACLLTCEDNDIRFAFGTNPTQAGLGHVMVSGAAMRLANPKSIRDFRCINKTNAADAVLQVTAEYNPG